MKKISFIILSAVLLSACSLKNPLGNSPKVTPATQNESTAEVTELSQEATSASDKDTLDDFGADNDSDFSAEFSSLEKDLQ